MSPLNTLTKQEAVILALVARGWRNATIASELFISVKTVETHLSHIFDKLGVSTRTQAALYHLEHLMSSEIRGNSHDNESETRYSET
jgi:DNA-binding NarL/FixJ family response regulator